jgi:hypothetical protein
MTFKRKPAHGCPPGAGDETSLRHDSKNDSAKVSQNRPRPQGRCYTLRDPRANPQRRPHECQPTERRLRQAAAIHSIGVFPLAQLLHAITEGGNPEEHIEDYADAAQALLLALTDAEGCA